MPETHEHIAELLERYIADTATEAEIRQLFLWLRDAEDDAPLRVQALGLWKEYESLSFRHSYPGAVTDMPKLVVPIHRVHFLRRGWLRYAAAVIVIIGAASLWYIRSNKTEKPAGSETVAQVIDIAPGKEGAILTLSDGRQIVLDSIGNGKVTSQNGVNVILRNGQLTYDLSEATTGEVAYNTITTPKGRQFQVVLPDGTRVWLNAASSLRYPTQFTGKAREVEVIGEAYFEVAQNAQQPFFVNIDTRVTVQVLGTDFNINAYKNEASIQTSLVKGSVKVSSTNNNSRENEILLKSGQQAQIFNDKLNITRQTFNITKVLAWKNGAFDFDGASLEEVMRQLERWYNIEVVYEKGVPDIHFVGKMSRDVTLSGLLWTLKASKVNFRLEEGRRLVVLP